MKIEWTKEYKNKIIDEVGSQPYSWVLDALDEIERLQNEINVRDGMLEQMANETSKEIKKLREALGHIVNACNPIIFFSKVDIQEVARKALYESENVTDSVTNMENDKNEN